MLWCARTTSTDAGAYRDTERASKRKARTFRGQNLSVFRCPLRGAYEESVRDHRAGAKSAPFEASEHGQVAVKVIDDRGNELMVVKEL